MFVINDFGAFIELPGELIYKVMKNKEQIQEQTNLLRYIEPPLLEISFVRIEKGFAESGKTGNIDGMDDGGTWGGSWN